MCEVRPFRERRPPPPTAHMRAVLELMGQTGQPAIWDYSRRLRRDDDYTVDGKRVRPSAVTGLSWRGLLQVRSLGNKRLAYELTEAGRALLEEE